jgi:hypothetical protein
MCYIRTRVTDIGVRFVSLSYKVSLIINSQTACLLQNITLSRQTRCTWITELSKLGTTRREVEIL